MAKESFRQSQIDCELDIGYSNEKDKFDKPPDTLAWGRFFLIQAHASRKSTP